MDKFRVPMGSLVVDAALVISLIVWGTTITNKLDDISTRVSRIESQDLDKRVDRTEQELVRRAEWMEKVDAKLDVIQEDTNDIKVALGIRNGNRK